MERVPAGQVIARMRAENPWWTAPQRVAAPFAAYRPRLYFDEFQRLVQAEGVRRAVLLMGPRRVGKTVLIHNAIGQLLEMGTDPRAIAYIAVDHPIYNGLGLEDLLERSREAAGTRPGVKRWVFFDEIQYLKNWEVHLKALVDGHPEVRCVASGSAAAALRLKSLESGAGRFTEFLLPPLTFPEYLDLSGASHLVLLPEGKEHEGAALPSTPDIDALNERFVHYLNFGGYPEVLFSPEIQADPGRFVKADIVDKVLLRDLPSLYGIQDIQELNYLFTTLAYNTAAEVSLDEISKGSGVAKNTIRRYIEYLEAAFLIRIVHRIDRNARRFQRANFFKVHLTNPSIRTALFSPVAKDDDVMGRIAETGVFAQGFHAQPAVHYARWDKGEVDFVLLGVNGKPVEAVEVKWSDRIVTHASEIEPGIRFCVSNGLTRLRATTRSLTTNRAVRGVEVEFVPTALHCWSAGWSALRRRT